MSLDNATKRVASCHMEAATITTIATTRTSSELSSESDSSEFLSDSESCRTLADLEQDNQEFKYSPLNGDSDIDNDSENLSDESIALLAHEILCCEHDSDTESDSDDDDDDDDDLDDLETKHNYALLMCSEDDDELDRDPDRNWVQEQQLLKLKQEQNRMQLKQQKVDASTIEKIGD